jgi:hypothetical protein
MTASRDLSDSMSHIVSDIRDFSTVVESSRDPPSPACSPTFDRPAGVFTAPPTPLQGSGPRWG